MSYFQSKMNSAPAISKCGGKITTGGFNNWEIKLKNIKWQRVLTDSINIQPATELTSDGIGIALER